MSPEVAAPAVHTLTDEQFYSKERPDLPDLNVLRDHFYREGRLTEDQALAILAMTANALLEEPNLLEVSAPITGSLRIGATRNRACVCLKREPYFLMDSVW